MTDHLSIPAVSNISTTANGGDGTVPSMSKGSLIAQRMVWTRVLAIVTFGFWLVGVGCGWRGVILNAPDKGIVAKAYEFGAAAQPWWIPAAVLTLTVVVMGIGVSLARHLSDRVPPVDLAGDDDADSSAPDVESAKPLELEPADDTADADGADADDTADADEADADEASAPVDDDADSAGGADDDEDGRPVPGRTD